MNNYFIAIDISEDIKSKILNLISDFKKIQNKGIKWINEEQLHITIKFLGNSENFDINKLIMLYNEINKSNSIELIIKSFKINIRNIGFFPNIKIPKVIWIGVDDNNELLNLHKIIDNIAYDLFDIPKDKRAFEPHITIGRIKTKIDNNLYNIIKIKNETVFGDYINNILGFYESELTPVTSIYKQIKYIKSI